MALSDSLRIEASPLCNELLHAAGVLDRVHRWPKLPAFPVVFTGSRREDGAYHSLSRPARPAKIEISLFAAYTSITFLHEVGHLLDHMVLNSSQLGFGSETDPIFDPLHEAWNKTRLFRKMLSRTKGKRQVVAQPIRRILTYQMRARELWARTYVQWAIAKSDDLLLASQLRAARLEGSIFQQIGADYYWDDDDFDRIISVVDVMFQQRGLL